MLLLLLIAVVALRDTIYVLSTHVLLYILLEWFHIACMSRNRKSFRRSYHNKLSSESFHSNSTHPPRQAA